MNMDRPLDFHRKVSQPNAHLLRARRCLSAVASGVGASFAFQGIYNAFWYGTWLNNWDMANHAGQGPETYMPPPAPPTPPLNFPLQFPLDRINSLPAGLEIVIGAAMATAVAWPWLYAHYLRSHARKELHE